jgi:Tol biopolymer transport system component
VAAGPTAERQGQKAFPPGTKRIYSAAIDGSQVRGLGVAGTALSRGPDGRIAFRSRTKVAVMTDDGGAVRDLAPVSSGSQNPYPPSWSPDGRRLAVDTGRQCDPLGPCLKWDIAVVDVASGKRVSTIRGGRAPSWSPRGQRIVYVGGRGFGSSQYKVRSGVFTARRDGRSRRLLVPGGGLAQWSPAGDLIGFYGRVPARGHIGVNLIRTDGTRARRVTRSEPIFAWSPDGRRLAYDMPFGIPTHVEVLTLTTGRRTRIGATSFNNPGAIAWSPDGTRLAYIQFDDPGDRDRLMVAAADGSGRPIQIAETYRRERMWTPVFSRDGKRVLYSVWSL